MAITINEIAKLANVSRATVDKVIHGRPGVKEETKVRIQEILDNLDYHPNLMGKALVMSKNPVKIGVILTPDYNPYVQGLLSGIAKGKREFEPFGFEVITRMLTALEPAEMISILLELENQNISGLALIPINDPAVIQKINQMQANGVKVMTFNSPLDEIKGFRYMGQDHKKAGMVAAGLMEKLLPEGGQVGVIISSAILSCHPDRLQGFSTRLAECKNPIRIVEIQENQDKREEAFRIALDYLNRYPDLDGLYLSGNGSEGVRSALMVSGFKKNIKIICHDLSSETEALLKEGVLDFVISQDARNQGYQLVRLMFDHLIKMITPSTYYYEIPIEIISREIVL